MRVFSLIATFVIVGCSVAVDPLAASDAGQRDADAGVVDFTECDAVDGGDPACTTPVYREYCRVEVLRKQHANGCVTEADCVLVPYATNCISWGLCAPAPVVRASLLSDFETARDAELSGFCARAPCSLGGSCAAFDTRVVCRQGRCEGEIF